MLQTSVASSIWRILLRVAIIALVVAAVAVMVVLKYVTDKGLRAPVETVRIPPSGIDQLSSAEVCSIVESFGVVLPCCSRITRH